MEAPMSKILDEVLAANADYVRAFGDKGSLPLPPVRRFAILTCMDARLLPEKYAGLSARSDGRRQGCLKPARFGYGL